MKRDDEVSQTAVHPHTRARRQTHRQPNNNTGSEEKKEFEEGKWKLIMKQKKVGGCETNNNTETHTRAHTHKKEEERHT